VAAIAVVDGPTMMAAPVRFSTPAGWFRASFPGHARVSSSLILDWTASSSLLNNSRIATAAFQPKSRSPLFRVWGEASVGIIEYSRLSERTVLRQIENARQERFKVVGGVYVLGPTSVMPPGERFRETNILVLTSTHVYQLDARCSSSTAARHFFDSFSSPQVPPGLLTSFLSA
jgi:hypothetical protein